MNGKESCDFLTGDGKYCAVPSSEVRFGVWTGGESCAAWGARHGVSGARREAWDERHGVSGARRGAWDERWEGCRSA